MNRILNYNTTNLVMPLDDGGGYSAEVAPVPPLHQTGVLRPEVVLEVYMPRELLLTTFKGTLHLKKVFV